MKNKITCKITALILTVLMTAGLLSGCGVSDLLGVEKQEVIAISGNNAEEEPGEVKESGEYTSKDNVAKYLHEYGHLPSNYITKSEAEELGWVSVDGNLGEVAPGKSIGGDKYGNYEGTLPDAEGRQYYECDIDTAGSYRGAKRIVYSNDGWIFYTEDHYDNFETLYEGEE